MSEQLYSLVENEKVLFELDCFDFEGGDASPDENILSKLLGGFFKSYTEKCTKSIVRFVVTDKRVFAVIQDTSGFCCCKKEERAYKEFPSSCFNGWNSYYKSTVKVLCCKHYAFRFTIGITRGSEFTSVSFSTLNIDTDEKAQAVIAKIDELASAAKR